jgi:hypothetical protein
VQAPTLVRSTQGTPMTDDQRVELFEHSVPELLAAPTSVGVRMWVRLHRWRLDRELAAGCAPDRSPAHRLRAAQLVDQASRRHLARSLREVVRAADSPCDWPLSSAVPIHRRAVLAVREGLIGLADRLVQPVPLNPCGVARVGLLLTDGAGPLYNPAPEGSIRDTLWWVADGLQL